MIEGIQEVNEQRSHETRMRLNEAEKELTEWASDVSFFVVDWTRVRLPVLSAFFVPNPRTL